MGSIQPGSLVNSDFAPSCGMEKSKFETTTSSQPVLMTSLRVHDAPTTVLPGTAATDDLALTVGTWGTNDLLVESSDSAADIVTQYMYFEVEVPRGYTGGTAAVLFACKMEVVSDGTATIDLEGYTSDEDATLTGDIVTTAAQSINSAAYATKTFTLNEGLITAGDRLLFRAKIYINDAATGSGVIANIASIKRQFAVYG